MRILRHFSKFVVFSEDELVNALHKINSNEARLIFAVSESGILEGVLTDGDIRRWLTRSSSINLGVSVASVMNRSFISATENEAPEKINTLLNEKVLAVPLLDGQGRMKAVAVSMKSQIEIEGRIIDDKTPSFLIAEIGNNHQGNLDLAFQLIDAAAEAGANCAKFQMRDMQELYRHAGSSIDSSADLGAQYTMDLLNRFQLDDNSLFKAFDYCRKKNLVPLCTPWDHSSLVKLESYGLPAYKVASADFTNHDLLESIASTGKPMFCSTGMCTEAEIREGVNHLQKIGANFLLLHCNSTYPAPFKDVNLNYLEHLRELSSMPIGYSGHERDIYISIAAVALGAKVIEKHFTLDKTLEGNDHKISLLPEEFKRMVDGIRQVEEALGTASDRRLSQGELMNRENLAKSLVAAENIPRGTVVTEKMLKIRSPGQGLQPNRKHDLIGTTLTIDKKAGDFFFPADLVGGMVQARAYKFPLCWGVPVRYHDLHAMRQQSNMDLLEIHLSYKDMELDFKEFISAPLDMHLVVHAPELFAGDHTLDLCSLDEEYRKHSIEQMQRVIDLTKEMAEYFLKTDRPCIVTNVGGFSSKAHLPTETLPSLYSLLENSLSQLNTHGVEIIPQTMPPFPWHFGGQQFHNLFVDAKSIIDFCKKNTMRVCLDVSHTKLACNYRNESFSDFLRKVLPYTAHMHLADAQGVDGEGLQIGEGELDWQEIFKIATQQNTPPSFIPEIWQGHKNGGESAWKALAALESAANDQIIKDQP